MKKFLLMLVAMFTVLTVSAQEVEAKWETELSGSFNFSNAEVESFKQSTFFNVQADFTKEVIGLYVGVGRGTEGAFSSQDKLQDYYGKVGATLNGNIGFVKLYALAGVGSYIKSDAVFVEYGGGFAVPISESLLIGCKAVNFNQEWFVAPTVSLKL